MTEHALVIRLVRCSNIKSYILNLNTYSKLSLECIIKVPGMIVSLCLYFGIKITGSDGGDRGNGGPFHSEREKTEGNFRDSLPQLLLLLWERLRLYLKILVVLGGGGMDGERCGGGYNIASKCKPVNFSQ